jgi:hypothetical protein
MKRTILLGLSVVIALAIGGCPPQPCPDGFLRDEASGNCIEWRVDDDDGGDDDAGDDDAGDDDAGDDDAGDDDDEWELDGSLDVVSVDAGVLRAEGAVSASAGIEEWGLDTEETTIHSATDGSFPGSEEIDVDIDLAPFGFDDGAHVLELWVRDLDGHEEVVDDESFLLVTCVPESLQQCYMGDVYHYDSCGNMGDLLDACDDGETCVNTTPTTAECSSNCGNGFVDSGESCDGTDLGGGSCLGLGYDGGTLTCSDCSYDDAGCWYCTPDVTQQCYDGDVYTYDSCGNLGSLVDPCATEQTCVNTTPTTAECSTNCGNWVIDAGEDCDGTNLNATTCLDLSFSGGSLACLDCAFDTSGCYSCAANDSQQCHSGDVYWYDSCGNLGGLADDCTTTEICNDTSPTTASCEGYCGNAVVDSVEDCDGSNLNSETCVTQGWDDGLLLCSSCSFDTSACYDCTANVSQQCNGGDVYWYDSCGNLGGLADDCTSTEFCTNDSSTAASCGGYCGNGVVDSDEDCDGSNLDAQTCISQGWDGGALICSACSFNTSACYDCTANVSQQCNSGDVYWYDSCGIPGGVADDCTLSEVCNNTSASTAVCEGFCGNGVVDPDEDCDGSNLDSQTCISQGWDGGALSCSSCSFNTSSCFYCTPNVSQQCYGGEVYWYDSCGNRGSIADNCTSSETCTETSPTSAYCQPDCGNGNVDSGEDCDGSNLNGQSCTTLGWAGGNLSCNSNCDYAANSCWDVSADPPVGTYTPDFTMQTSCTCSPSDTDCHTIYRGRAYTLDASNNTVTMRFTKAQGGGGPSVTSTYWVVVGDPFPDCNDLSSYQPRETGTWSSTASWLQVQNVDIWPSLSQLESASCGAEKELFVITGGSGGPTTRTWFEKQSVTFEKECGP